MANKDSTCDNGTPATTALPHIKERAQFRALVLANPNYFGNLPESAFTPVLNISSNTFYEAIGCVGLQPQFDRLEAVVYVYQPSGYGGGVCSNGSQEYVRFYMTCDHGATWEDLGLASFTAYDIPAGTLGDRRLEYAVSLTISPKKKLCFISNVCEVRAILSWNVPPPPGNPHFVPVWGDVHDTYVQIEPAKLISWPDFFKVAKIKLPPSIETVLDVNQNVALAAPIALSTQALKELYKDKAVEPHRYALAEMNKLMVQPSLTAALMAPDFKGFFPDLGISLDELLGNLFPQNGSTRYEQLECIGYNPNLSTLAGVIRVKLPSGYSGGLCTKGSTEYVTFWADFNNNGTFETCLGTTSVNVHDISAFPKEGLEYAVFLPVNMDKFRLPCYQGPRLVPIRAILSWEVAPPCNNPNYVPVWGNRLETLIHIKPGQVPLGHFPIIQTVGSMDTDDINPLGLANGVAALAGFTASDSPFGGEVLITGHLANPTDISQGATKLQYRVEVSNDGGGSWNAITTNLHKFWLGRDQLDPLLGWSGLPSVLQQDVGGGWFEYQEDLSGGPGNPQIFPVGNMLMRWQTSGLTGLWSIRVIAKDPISNITWTGAAVAVRLDNAAPVPHLTITSGGGACADFLIGNIIEGTYSVTDEHFGSLSIAVEPGLGGTFTQPIPMPAYPVAATTGAAGVWKLDTTGMPRCGYVIRLGAWDRTIVNSGYVGFYNADVVGLCLRETVAIDG